MAHKFPYKWLLSDGYPSHGIIKNNLKVFGTFICGGGSSMGYKLAGYNHMGGVEIDNKIAPVYKKNHNPKYLFNEDIRDFLKRDDIPLELFDLDILDGSPPCSSFSLSGVREDGWGVKKTFREGQAKQQLDDLFFTYIALAKKLQPKVIIAENVKGMLVGNARMYVKKIEDSFIKAGYKVQLFLCNSAVMGVPQKRERVFFIARRQDLPFPDLKLHFDEPIIPYKEISDKSDVSERPLNTVTDKVYHLVKPGNNFSRIIDKNRVMGFNSLKLSYDKPVPTITATPAAIYHPTLRRYLNKTELCLAGSYPLDYDFGILKPRYLIGMSVPPVMIANIANSIYEQWFSTL
jgi:DNA (cytosine-5)-methyltransferase 1